MQFKQNKVSWAFRGSESLSRMKGSPPAKRLRISNEVKTVMAIARSPKSAGTKKRIRRSFARSEAI